LKVYREHVTLDVVSNGAINEVVFAFESAKWVKFAIFTLRVLILLGVTEIGLIDKSLLYGIS